MDYSKLNWNYEPKLNEVRFDSATGKPLTPTVDHWIRDDKGSHVCLTNSYGVSRDTNADAAYARLISAAPDLLRACLSAIRALNGDAVQATVEAELKEAIAKATETVDTTETRK